MAFYWEGKGCEKKTDKILVIMLRLYRTFQTIIEALYCIPLLWSLLKKECFLNSDDCESINRKKQRQFDTLLVWLLSVSGDPSCCLPSNSLNRLKGYLTEIGPYLHAPNIIGFLFKKPKMIVCAANWNLPGVT